MLSSMPSSCVIQEFDEESARILMSFKALARRATSPWKNSEGRFHFHASIVSFGLYISGHSFLNSVHFNTICVPGSKILLALRHFFPLNLSSFVRPQTEQQLTAEL